MAPTVCHSCLLRFVVVPHFKYVIPRGLNMPFSSRTRLGGVLIFGVGLELSGTICAIGIYFCIAFYATSKILIYFFLSGSILFISRTHLLNRLLFSRKGARGVVPQRRSETVQVEGVSYLFPDCHPLCGGHNPHVCR
jgi:hypothetical protein